MISLHKPIVKIWSRRFKTALTNDVTSTVGPQAQPLDVFPFILFLFRFRNEDCRLRGRESYRSIFPTEETFYLGASHGMVVKMCMFPSLDVVLHAYENDVLLLKYGGSLTMKEDIKIQFMWVLTMTLLLSIARVAYPLFKRSSSASYKSFIGTR